VSHYFFQYNTNAFGAEEVDNGIFIFICCQYWNSVAQSI